MNKKIFRLKIVGLICLFLIAIGGLGWLDRPALFPAFFPQVLTGHHDEVVSVAFSPDGRTIASGSGKYWEGIGETRLWDAHTGSLLRTLRDFHGIVQALAFSPDGRILATGTAFPEGGICFWDVQEGRLIRRLTGNVAGWKDKKHGSWVWSLAFSPDARLLASSNDGLVQLWDTKTGSLLHTLRDMKEDETMVKFSPDGRVLACQSKTGVAFGGGNPDHPDAHITGGYVKIVDVASGKVVRTISDGPSEAAVFSPDGKSLAASRAIYNNDVIHTGGILTVYDAQTGAKRWTRSGNNLFIPESLAFTPDGKFLAGECADNQMRIWDAETGRPVRVFQAFHGFKPITGNRLSTVALAFSPDGKTLAGRMKNTVVLWDMERLQ